MVEAVLQPELRMAGLQLVDELFASPFITAPEASRMLSITNPGASSLLRRLVNLGILNLIEGSWPRLYVARELLESIELARMPDPIA